MGRYWKLKENAIDRSLCKIRYGRVRDYKMMMRIDTWPTGESVMNIGNFFPLKLLHIRTLDASVIG
jgi:hypothetical protein